MAAYLNSESPFQLFHGAFPKRKMPTGKQPA